MDVSKLLMSAMQNKCVIKLPKMRKMPHVVMGNTAYGLQ